MKFFENFLVGFVAIFTAFTIVTIAFFGAVSFIAWETFSFNLEDILFFVRSLLVISTIIGLVYAVSET